MKKYIFTETQIKKMLDNLVNEQAKRPVDNRSAEEKMAEKNRRDFDAVYNNPPIAQQMKKYPPNTKFGFSTASLPKVDNDGANVLYQVKPGDTIDGIVRKLGANSAENILWSNDMLKNDPKKLQAGMVIIYSKRPSH
jgi:hypothetical protein